MKRIVPAETDDCSSLFDREQKDPVYLKDKVSQKHSKEQFESAQKVEQEYSKFFTGSYAEQTTVAKQATPDHVPVTCSQNALSLQVLSKAAPSLTFALRS